MSDNNEREYMSGGCFALALYLHEKTGLPLLSLADDDGHVHHACVSIPDGRFADARGILPDLYSLIRYKGRLCAGQHPETIEYDELKRMAIEQNMLNYSPQALNAFVRKTRALNELMPEPKRKRPSNHFDMS